MKMIGLKDGNVLATDENGAMEMLKFEAGKETEVSEKFAGVAIGAGYAKVAESTGSDAA